MTAAKPRPQAVRASATRQRILTAALGEFAEKGLAGARIDDIAERGGVNKRMIYAYFGKRDEENALRVADLPAREAMVRLVSFNLRYTAAHPEFVALLNQENLHRGQYLAGSETVRALYTPLLDMIRGVLERGRAEGVFRAGVDPKQLYITIVGISHFYVANHYTLSNIFGGGLMNQAALGEREAHCIAVVLDYLRPPLALDVAAVPP